MKATAAIAAFLLAVLVMSNGSLAATELAAFGTSLFSGAAHCAFCHDQWRNGLTDKQGNDVSIATDWRATMMAHSFKDPLCHLPHAVHSGAGGGRPDHRRIPGTGALPGMAQQRLRPQGNALPGLSPAAPR